MNEKTLNLALIAGASLVALYVVYQVVKVSGTIAEVASTKDTAYEGFGVAGTAGNVVNKASGGFFETVGSWIGGKAADLHDYVTGVPKLTA